MNEQLLKTSGADVLSFRKKLRKTYVLGLTFQDHYSHVDERGFGNSVAPLIKQAHLTLTQMNDNFGAILQYTHYHSFKGRLSALKHLLVKNSYQQ